MRHQCWILILLFQCAPGACLSDKSWQVARNHINGKLTFFLLLDLCRVSLFILRLAARRIFFPGFVSRRDLGAEVWMKRGTHLNWLDDLGRLCCCNILNEIFTSVGANMLIPGEGRTFIGQNRGINGCSICTLMPQTFSVETWWAKLCRYQKTIVFVALLSDWKVATIYTAGAKNILGIRVPEQKISLS